jgi:hypothetical protein
MPNADHIFPGNVWDWQPLQTFDFVNTTLFFVANEVRVPLVHRLLDRKLRLKDACS